MNSLRHTDGSKVAVALICEHDIIGICTLKTRCNSRGTSVSRFDHIAREIIIRHNCAAYWSNADCSALDAEIVYSLGDKAVDYAVGAAGAVMQFGVGKALRLFKILPLFKPSVHFSDAFKYLVGRQVSYRPL